MKGIVFNLLETMVEEKLGMEAWDNILQAANSDGVYVSTDTYSDEELIGLVGAASAQSGIPANELVRMFGEYMLPHFHDKYPDFFTNATCLKDFLLTVDRVIHVEVRKLHPGASLPEFNYVDDNSNELTMVYSSPRKMCMLAEGLIAGAALHFGEQYTMSHDKCMHNGEDACELHLKIAV